MIQASIPYKFATPWAADAASGYITNTIPATTSVTGYASQQLGFPPANDTPIGSGGVPPKIADFNGILYYLSAWVQWQQAGGANIYDATFASEIGGYPRGAIVPSSVLGNIWQNQVDNNSTNPDTGGANWVSIFAPYAKLTGATFSGAVIVDANLTSTGDVQGGALVSTGATYTATQISFTNIPGFSLGQNGSNSLLNFASGQYIQFVPGYGIYYTTSGTNFFSGNSTFYNLVNVASTLETSSRAYGSGNPSQVVTLADFSNDFGSSYFYERLPDGGIIQGYIGATVTGNDTINFPIAFPNTCLEVVVCEGAVEGWEGTTPNVFGVASPSSTSFALQVLKWTGSGWTLATGITYRYIAIGN